MIQAYRDSLEIGQVIEVPDDENRWKKAVLKEKYRDTCLLEYKIPYGSRLMSPSYIWLYLYSKGKRQRMGMDA